MAISKTIELNDTGVSVSYWRITAVQIDHQSGICDFNIHGYISQEAREHGKSPLPVIQCRVTAIDLGIDSLHELATKNLYDAVIAGKIPNNEGVTILIDGIVV